jgi:hypothetical protein
MSQVYPGPMGCHDDDIDKAVLSTQELITELMRRQVTSEDIKRYQATIKSDIIMPTTAATAKTAADKKYDASDLSGTVRSYTQYDVEHMLEWLDEFCVINVDNWTLTELWIDFASSYTEDQDLRERWETSPGWPRPYRHDMQSFAKWLCKQEYEKRYPQWR